MDEKKRKGGREGPGGIGEGERGRKKRREKRREGGREEGARERKKMGKREMKTLFSPPLSPCDISEPSTVSPPLQLLLSLKNKKRLNKQDKRSIISTILYLKCLSQFHIQSDVQLFTNG